MVSKQRCLLVGETSMATTKLIQLLSNNLSEDSKEEVLFLCMDLGKIDSNVSFSDNLLQLSMEQKLTFVHIAEALFHVGRLDLIKTLLHLDVPFVRSCIQKKSLFSRTKILLLQAHYKLCSDDLKSLKFFLRNVMGTTEANFSFLQLTLRLKQWELITDASLEFLSTCLEQIGRLDVAFFIRTHS